MSGLGLVPNKIVGFRIKPDWYNFTVVVVKQYGTSSKKAGQEYEEALAYCKSLESAASWLIEHVVRVKGEELQAEIEAKAKAEADALAGVKSTAKTVTKTAEEVFAGSIASAEALVAAIALAKEAAHGAIADIEARLRAAGLETPKQVTHFMGGEAPEESATDAA